jgi:hypothetical protein
METIQQRKVLTLGALIHNLYLACGKRRANGILRLASKCHLIVVAPGIPARASLNGLASRQRALLPV